MNKEKFILIGILLGSVLIRTYRVGDTPPLLWDEAALGYNAYSILQTAHDEHGQLLPLIFKSFGDYKPGIYIYLTLPCIAIFGLNPFSVRLPSILSGSLIPLLLYLLIRQLLPRQRNLATLSALIMVFNPFNIHFSRGAWETNILTFQILLASLLFFRKKYLTSAIIFGISLYTYQSAKLLSPLIILALIISTQSNLRSILNKFFLPLLTISIPLIYGIVFGQDSNRLKVMSLLSYPRSTTETQTIITESNITNYQLFHNQLIFFSRNFFSRYFNHFSPRFLIFEGDWQNPRHSAPYVGLLLYPSIVFFLIGLLSSDYRLPATKLLLLWLILAPIPSALTRDSVSAVRALPLSIPSVYFIATGINIFLYRYKSITIYCLLFTVYILSFTYYSDLYLNHMVKRSPKDFLYGYSQAINYVIQNQSKYQQVIFTQFYGQPYIYYLFYSHYSPSSYQQQNSYNQNGLDTGVVSQIGNVYFKEPQFNQVELQPGTLAIFSHDEVLRQNIDPQTLISLSPIGGYSTFYAYENP